MVGVIALRTFVKLYQISSNIMTCSPNPGNELRHNMNMTHTHKYDISRTIVLHNTNCKLPPAMLLLLSVYLFCKEHNIKLKISLKSWVCLTYNGS